VSDESDLVAEAIAMINPGDLLSARADSDAVAVHDLTGGRERDVSYRELAAGVDALARGLVAHGLAPGAKVALVSANRIEFLESFFGIMKAGCVPLPISIRLPAESLAALIEEARPDLVLCDGARAPALAGAIDFDDPGPRGYRAFVRPGSFIAVERPPQSLAMQPYSSGSTGLPKGIQLSQSAVRWALSKMRPPGRPDNAGLVVTVAHPLYHKNAMLGTKGAFLYGGRIVMMERFEPARFVEAIGRYGVTKIHTVPTMMARILADRELLARCRQDTVQEVHMGSAPVSRKLFDDVRAAFPQAYVRISYGVTEAGPMQFGEHPDGVPRPPLSIGYPLADVELRLVGGSSPDEGVLQVRNAGLMIGYDGRPEQTRERFTDDGWYVTGDVLRRDAQGFFYFVGRDDDMFTVGGHNLYPATVEATLLRHPDVHQAAVVAVEDEVRGHVPVAFVRARAGARIDEATLQQFAREHAPPHEYPRRVILIDELPVAGTGKIDYRGLREQARRLLGRGPRALT
jgi:acyl-CoA synthetase (AMP-forming)/AMP-acid ligase II